MPLRSELDRWNLHALTDWATAVHDSNETMLEQIDKARKYFTDLGNDWTGTAFHAAYDRVGQDHDQARKVYHDISDFLSAFGTSVANVSSHRDVLRAKAADAEGANLKVADNWVCSGTNATDVHAHQDAINTAYRELAQAEAELGRLLTSRGELIRAAGDLFGSSIEVDQAPNSGARLGGEDGTRLADAARKHDRAAIDAIAAAMPQYQLTPQDLQDLAAGKQVTDIPADVQDYYREFFKNSGKDGLFALSDQLTQEETAAANSGIKTNIAGMQRDNLANAILMTSNEKVGSTSADGTFHPGGINQLPSYMQHLVGDRLEANPPKTALEMKTRLEDQTKFAKLLGEANPGFVPGTAMSGQMAATSASMASYLDGHNPAVTSMVERFKHEGAFDIGDKYFDADKPGISDAAKSYLDLATRNHQTDYQLLSNPTEQVHTPGDIYADPKTFRNEIFNHDWGDKGKLASQLYDWAGEHTHDQTPDGDLSRKTLAALPEVFSPTHTDNGKSGLTMGTGGHTTFENNAELFKKNPELATGLSKVLAPNLDALSYDDQHKTVTFPNSDPSTYPKPTSTDVIIGRDEGDRLLFLSNQSEDGRHLLDTARTLRENTFYDQAMKQGGNVGNNLTLLDEQNHIQSLNSRMTAQQYNALFYQDQSGADAAHNAAMKVYESHQKAAEVAKSLVDSVNPADKITKPLTELLPSSLQDPTKQYTNGLPDKWMDSAIQTWNPKPETPTIQTPSTTGITSNIHDEISNQLLDSAYRNEQLPSTLLNDDSSGPIQLNDSTSKDMRAGVTDYMHNHHIDTYSDRYKSNSDVSILIGLDDTQDKLKKFLNGGGEVLQTKDPGS
ncbi:WXG100 family type VII secretion target [Nocardia macrotermitis]|uniref:TPR repeat domain-containing protein n=1 Tax=Nocardia macrotermitis TaxID=2585198 RepID=A0A7K0DEY1_9NOCA|nr:hypothetical protein [Nocardia macrotermitis]MQY24350.1 hypothetical protein [Nocardia macrotermitis]